MAFFGHFILAAFGLGALFLLVLCFWGAIGSLIARFFSWLWSGPNIAKIIAIVLIVFIIWAIVR